MSAKSFDEIVDLFAEPLLTPADREKIAICEKRVLDGQPLLEKAKKDPKSLSTKQRIQVGAVLNAKDRIRSIKHDAVKRSLRIED